MSFLIKGMLTDSNGNPLSGYTVKAFDRMHGLHFKMMT
jgi:hypothetical protein